jgi:hypothetical protein
MTPKFESSGVTSKNISNNNHTDNAMVEREVWT